IGLVGSAQFPLVANPSLLASTLADLITLIGRKPGHFSYCSSGAPTPHPLFMEMFLKTIGARAQHVPYRASAQPLTSAVAALTGPPTGLSAPLPLHLAVSAPMATAPGIFPKSPRAPRHSLPSPAACSVFLSLSSIPATPSLPLSTVISPRPRRRSRPASRPSL